MSEIIGMKKNEITNPIQLVIMQELKDRKISVNFLAQQIGTSQQNLFKWFHSPKAGIDKLHIILNYLDLDIVKIKKFREFDKLRNEAKQNKSIK